MSNTEYPKMLYSGNKESYSSRIIHTAEEEQRFREIGLTDYADLPEPELKVEEVTPSEAPQGFVTTEQFDAVAERLAAAETEIERLKQISVPTQAFVPEMKNETSDVVEKAVDYSNFTIPELQAELDAKGIKYLARDNKDTLIKLLEESNV